MEARLSAFEQAKQDMYRSASVSMKSVGSKLPIFADAWSNIGPTSNGNIAAGCTKALAFDPSNSKIIYAGGAAGGVWKSTDGGSSWLPLTDNVIPDLAISSIAVDPSNTKTVYVGTGDPAVAIDALGGSGLYKTTDGGATWSRIAASTFKGTVNKVFVHPSNSSIVFATSYDASSRGLYRSTDGGATFSRVFPTSGNAGGIIWDVISAQTVGNNLIMYFVEGNNPGGSSAECGVYKSVNGGSTWAKITSGGLPGGSSIGKAALGVTKYDKTRVYCLMANPNGDLSGAGLYFSSDGGTTFNKITVPSTLFNVGAGAQGWYDLYLGVAPSAASHDTLYIGGVEAYRSYNGGSSWSAYSDYGSHSNVHVDNQSIAIDPNNSRTVFIGTDGGVYKSGNSGSSWSYSSNGMMTMRVYHIALDAGDFKKTLAGFQDQGYWKTVTGQSPSQVWGGDGFQPIVDPTNSNIWYVEGPQGDLIRISGTTPSDITGSNFEANAPWDAPFRMAPKNSQTLFTGRTKLWWSNNSGTSWTAASPAFGGYVSSIGLSPSDANVWWLGMAGGAVKVTTDGGATWSDASTGVPKNSILSIVCHPTNSDFAIISLASYSQGSARVMLTTNGGTSWTDVSGTSAGRLPGVPVNCVAIDSTNPSSVWYAATFNGIYYTTNAGAKWTIAGSGLGLAACYDVQVHANGKTIRVGTHGRSIWEANTNILPVELTGLTATKTSKGTQLSWRTDSEISNSGFYITRSYNYAPFERIGFVEGAGNSNTQRNYAFLDSMFAPGHYTYQLQQVDLDGTLHLSNMVDVSYGASAQVRLDQNFPNPFIASATAAGSTRIRYQLADEDVVTLKIYAATGAVVRTLVNHLTQAGGEQDAFWDGTDDAGTSVESGAYFYTLETASGARLTNKMIFVRK